MSQTDSVPAIEARGLSKTLGGVVAVDGLSLAIAPGEVFGLVGPDGAGKTTALRMLCGVLRPTSGAASVLGFDVATEADEVGRRVGYMPQRFSLYPELTVAENLLFRARVHDIAGRILDERLDSLLTLTQLGRFRHRLAGALSGGMKQKLALAAALLPAPGVLVLDEPTTGVDPASRGDFWEMLLGLAEKGTTVMAATSYMDEAERCRRVGLLYQGRLLVCGSPDEIRRQAGLSLLLVLCQPLRHARSVLQEASGVRWVKVVGDRLHVALGSGGTADTIQESLQRMGVRVSRIQPIEPALEDAFFEFVRARREPGV